MPVLLTNEANSVLTVFNSLETYTNATKFISGKARPTKVKIALSKSHDKPDAKSFKNLTVSSAAFIFRLVS